MTSTRTVLSSAAALLAQGRTLDALSRLLTALALIGVLFSAAIGPPAFAGFLVAIAVAGLAEAYFAVRVGFDAALFDRLATAPDPPDFAELDRALAELGLRPAATRDRPAGERIAGATRLMRLQLIALVIQLLSVAAGAIVLWWR